MVAGQRDAWWLDERTKRLVQQLLHLSGTLTFTVREGHTLRLSCQQVGCETPVCWQDLSFEVELLP